MRLLQWPSAAPRWPAPQTKAETDVQRLWLLLQGQQDTISRQQRQLTEQMKLISAASSSEGGGGRGGSDDGRKADSDRSSSILSPTKTFALKTPSLDALSGERELRKVSRGTFSATFDCVFDRGKRSNCKA